jgi:hypothetical protein
MPDFFTKLDAAQRSRTSSIALLLSPRMDRLPLPIQRYDDPFLPLSRAIIEATQDIVCAYVFDFAAYMALAAAGARALERAIGFVNPDTVKVLHGPFVGTAYSAMVERTAFDVDAITIYQADDVAYYQRHAPFGAVQSGPLIAATKLTISDGLSLYVTDEDVMFAGRGDDFAEQVRERVLDLKDGV